MWSLLLRIVAGCVAFLLAPLSILQTSGPVRHLTMFGVTATGTGHDFVATLASMSVMYVLQGVIDVPSKMRQRMEALIPEPEQTQAPAEEA